MMYYKIGIVILFILIILFISKKKEKFTDYPHYSFITDKYNYVYNTFQNMLYGFPSNYWNKKIKKTDETLYDKEIRSYLYDWHSSELY